MKTPFKTFSREDCILEDCKGEEQLFLVYYSNNKKWYFSHKISFYLPEITSISNIDKRSLTASGKRFKTCLTYKAEKKIYRHPSFLYFVGLFSLSAAASICISEEMNCFYHCSSLAFFRRACVNECLHKKCLLFDNFNLPQIESGNILLETWNQTNLTVKWILVFSSLWQLCSNFTCKVKKHINKII